MKYVPVERLHVFLNMGDRRHEIGRLALANRLTHVGKFGMGALVYEPRHASESRPADQLDLDRLAEEAIQIVEGEVEDVVSELLELAGSSAGARPKIMVDPFEFIR